MTLGRAKKTARRIHVHDGPATQLSAYPPADPPGRGHRLGHDQPTLLVTNRPGR